MQGRVSLHSEETTANSQYNDSIGSLPSSSSTLSAVPDVKTPDFFSEANDPAGPSTAPGILITPEDIEKKQFADAMNIASNVMDGSNFIAAQTSTVFAMSSLLLSHVNENNEALTQESADILNEGREIGLAAGLALSILAAVVWFVSQNKHVKKHHIQDDSPESFASIRKKLNPWYSRFRTASTLGNNFGQILAECLFLLPIMPEAISKPIKAIFGAAVGFLFGVVAATFMNDDPSQNTFFKWGREGWSRYTYPGLPIGGILGGGIGAAIGFFTPFPGGALAGIAIGTAVGSIIGFAAFAIGVPLYHFIQSHLSSPPRIYQNVKKLALVLEYKLGLSIIKRLIDKIDHAPQLKPFLTKKKADEKKEEPPPYRTNYIRAGTAIGTQIGTILGFVVGLFLPFPLSSIACSAMGAGAGALLGSILIGFIGPYISDAINKQNNNFSSWDYGSRTGAMFGNQYGLGSIVTGTLNYFGIGKNLDIKNLACNAGGLIGFLVGGAYDLYCSYTKRYHLYLMPALPPSGELKNNQYQKTYIFTQNPPKLFFVKNGEAKEVKVQDSKKLAQLVSRCSLDPTKPLQKQLNNDQLEKFWFHITNKEKPILPWSQRVGTFAWGASLVGEAIGFFAGGPIGILIGGGIGGILGGIIGAAWGDQIFLKIAKASTALHEKIIDWCSKPKSSENEKKLPPSHHSKPQVTSTTYLHSEISKQPISQSTPCAENQKKIVTTPTTPALSVSNPALSFKLKATTDVSTNIEPSFIPKATTVSP